MTRNARCSCGQVRVETVGQPIVTAVCYCNDCQAGGKLIENLPDAPTVLESDGGASYLVFRDDKYTCVAGRELLQGLKLKPRSPTQRFVATCCNSAMYLKYKRGHWVSAYRDRLEDTDLPKIEMRTNTRYRNSDVPISTDAPSYRRFPLRLFAKLLRSRVDMSIGR